VSCPTRLPVSLAAVLWSGEPLSGVGLSHWVVKEFASPSSTCAVSTPGNVYRPLTISGRLAASALCLQRTSHEPVL
jgi:hypothetical protein